MPTKTIKQTLEYRFPEWFITTEKLFNEVTAFYFGIIKERAQILELTNKKALTELERLTHSTKDNPAPPFPLKWDIPAMFRRACINTAIGAARSFFSKLKKWKDAKAKAEAKEKKLKYRPPVPPREWQRNTLFYAGQYKGYTGKSIMLKLFDGNTWRWVKYHLTGRRVQDGWKIGCPHAVIKKNRLELHFPVEKEKPVVKAVAEQVKEPSLKICAVGLNISNRLAVCGIFKSDGTQVATRFIRGGDSLSGRRKRLLGIIATKLSLTGSLNKDEQDNKALRNRIHNIDDNEAHRVSRRILDFALEHGATIIVFEYLNNFKPEQGKFSRRASSKRSYWLLGRIFHYTKYKAWEYGIIISRVNPRNTSRLCADCGAEIARHSDNKEYYRSGAPLFTCKCGKKGSVALNAVRNIGKRLFLRYAV
ncbi:RNA-guided endonuclease TnpB family protein [Pelotomaculum terephthalicicum JT]|uniref:RNA-guided endonuclease TnpB family protein n=1 Tax=Pelotomaculum terephthalicicum TaxID=206393 RepID=UPI001F04B1E7|nr:RNA-guided endonuclease TnpB family protein [Pelotomaculum terephthalicicum]MCG9967398.1 RNA-guided endonuclease TnpB family protein [Pelotomaculum terephthalicicum JT]